MHLGFVGTGTMGAPMANCLIDAGHVLTVYDVRTEATLALGARGAPAPAPGILAGLQPGSAYIDMTTNAPAVARRIAEACRARGVDMLDAPVSGRPPTMTVMAGGEEAGFAKYPPLL